MSNKQQVIQHLNQLLDQRIAELKTAIANVQNSANSETKSSAGDKYETARAMAQNERDILAKQHLQVLQNKRLLEGIDMSKKNVGIGFGTLIETSAGYFFIALSMGIIMLANQRIVCISPDSPVGKLLSGKKTGDTFLFQQTITTILSML